MPLMHATIAQLRNILGLVTAAGADDMVEVHGITTDSRAVVAGNLFVALRGEHFDAHDFVAATAAQGAAAVIVERPLTELATELAIPMLVVPNTRIALGTIARYWRQQFVLPLIGVTGSNGKTTVKEMIAAILSAAYGAKAYLATQGNFNNEIGVPLTLFRLQAEHHCAVIELGMNHPGEIAVLADIAQPTVGLVNNAQREHQEFMATVEAVARENGAVISALPADGVAVFPADDAYSQLWRDLAGQRPVIRFGFSENAEISASYQEEDFGNLLHIVARHAGQTQRFAIRLAAAGQHNVRNALAAIACAYAVGIKTDAIVSGLEAFMPVNGRLQRKTAVNGALVIDDTYNANPDSVRAAIDVLAHAAQPRILVLGDMGEVGSNGRLFHEEIGAYAQQHGITHFLGLGDSMQYAVQAFNAATPSETLGATSAQHFGDVDALNAALAAIMTPTTTVLVKGSRFMKMERIVQHLIGALTQHQKEAH